jgi:hypothetical protein
VISLAVFGRSMIVPVAGQLIATARTTAARRHAAQQTPESDIPGAVPLRRGAAGGGLKVRGHVGSAEAPRRE